MKKLTGLFIVLMALVLGSYYAMGWLTERALKKSIAIINQSNGVVLTILKDDRGWFTSHTDVKARIHIPTHMFKNDANQLVTFPEKEYELVLPMIIHHGPIIYTHHHFYFGFGFATLQASLPKEYSDYLDTVYTKDSTKPTLTLNLFVNYLGKTSFQLSIPQFELRSIDAQKSFQWLGLESDVSVSYPSMQLSGHVASKGAVLTQGSREVTIGPIESDYNLHSSDTGLYVGDAHVLLSSLRILEAKQNVFALQAFDLKSKSDIENQLFHSTLSLSLDQVSKPNGVYGPAALVLAVDNLDAPILAQINRELSRMTPTSDQERQQLLLALLPKLPELLSHGASINLSTLNVTLPEGLAQGHLSLSLPKENMPNPFQLIQKIKGDCMIDLPTQVLQKLLQTTLKQKILGTLELEKSAMHNNASTEASTPTPVTPESIDEQALQQAKEKIAGLLKAGLITTQGGHDHLDLQLNDAHLIVNGKPFTPSMLQF